MTRLSESIGLGSHELISIVGAGGKTTLLALLGVELTGQNERVVLTTTTRMALEQITEPVCWTDETHLVERALLGGSPLFVLTGSERGKVTGLTPDAVDRIFMTTSVDHVIVEADGAWRKLIKAPASYEPVIPSASTTVMVVVGAGAVGGVVGDVAHRVERVLELTGLSEGDVLTPQHIATVLLHPEGGLRSVPPDARAVMVISGVNEKNSVEIADLVDLLESNQRIHRCVLLPVCPAA